MKLVSCIRKSQYVHSLAVVSEALFLRLILTVINIDDLKYAVNKSYSKHTL